MKVLLANLIVMASLLPGTTRAEVAESEPALSGVVERLRSNGNWRSPTAVRELEVLLESGIEEAEELSANVLLAFYLAEEAANHKTDAAARMRDICAVTTNEAPDSWQGAVAQVLLANERGFAGDYESQITLASNALETIDFQSLEAERDPALVAIRHALGDKPFIFREVLKYTLAAALAKTGRLAEAEQIQRAITDLEFKSAAEKQVVRMESIEQRIRARDSEHNQEASSSTATNDPALSSSQSGIP